MTMQLDKGTGACGHGRRCVNRDHRTEGINVVEHGCGYVGNTETAGTTGTILINLDQS